MATLHSNNDVDHSTTHPDGESAPATRDSSTTLNTHDPSETIFTRVGGTPVVRGAVQAFFQRLSRDHRTSSLIRETALTGLQHHQESFLTAALGGVSTGTGTQDDPAPFLSRVDPLQVSTIRGHLIAAFAVHRVPESVLSDIRSLEHILAPALLNELPEYAAPQLEEDEAPLTDRFRRQVNSDEQDHDVETPSETVERSEVAALDDIIRATQAIIEFEPDGTIITANDKYLAIFGYTLAQIQGAHHGIFVAASDKRSTEYTAFWEQLQAGEAVQGTFKYFDCAADERWLDASYYPLCDQNGQPYKVVCIATDVTEYKLHANDYTGQIAAVNRSHATIQFDLDGTIRTANDNFLQMFGYTLQDVQGRHHSMFVDPEYASSREYQEFWASLGRGEYQASVYRRIARGGRDIYIHASYNPIADANGKPYKIIKFARDVTDQKIQAVDNSGLAAAISKSQATIEFELDGTIITANDNFLHITGYELSEIRGKHHSLLVDHEYGSSTEYQERWSGVKQGEHHTAEYRALGKEGREVYFKASYHPILDLRGKPYKIIEVATDITSYQVDRDRVRKTAAQETLAAIRSYAQSLASSSDELASVCSRMASNTHESSARAGVVAAAAERTNRDLQSQASVVEQLDANIKKIARNAREAANVVASVTHASGTAGTNGGHHEEQPSPDTFTRMVPSLIQRMDILALNARIEAAHAGEAGGGFGVVAAEIKDLAREFGKLTDGLTTRSTATRVDARQSHDTGRSSASIIERIHNIVTAIAGAVEEQAATTQEMHRNLSETSRGVSEIAKDLSVVATDSQRAAADAGDCERASTQLASLSADLLSGTAS